MVGLVFTVINKINLFPNQSSSYSNNNHKKFQLKTRQHQLPILKSTYIFDVVLLYVGGIVFGVVLLKMGGRLINILGLQ
jgi:hypothetical protein